MVVNNNNNNDNNNVRGNKLSEAFVTIKIIIIIVLFVMSLISGDMSMVDTLLRTIVGCL